MGGGCLNLCQVAKKIVYACWNYTAAKLQYLRQYWLKQMLHQLSAMLRYTYINFCLVFVKMYSVLCDRMQYRRKGNIFFPQAWSNTNEPQYPFQRWAPDCLKIYRTVSDSLHLTWIHLSCFFQYRASTSFGTLRCKLGYFPGATILFPHIETNKNDTLSTSKCKRGYIIM